MEDQEQFIESLDFASPETFIQEPEPISFIKEEKQPKQEVVAPAAEGEKVPQVEAKTQVSEYGYKRYKQKMGR